jgi:peroxiredoxin
MAAALEAGDKAPDFTLPSTSGEKISLTQFRGEEAGAPRILRG